MTDESGEPELWARACANDGDAFGVLFDLHRPRVYRRAFGLLGGQHDAEDVTAAAFFELWRKRRSVRVVDGSVLPWLLVTTVNLARNVQRTTARYQRLLRASARGETVTAPPDAEQIEAKQRLTESLARLAPADGALFILTSVEGFSIAEAAEAVGTTTGAARMRLHRARIRLRTELHDLATTTSSTEGIS